MAVPPAARRVLRLRSRWWRLGLVVGLLVVARLGVSGPSEPAAAPTGVPVPSAPPGVSGGWQLTAENTGLSGAGVDRSTLPVFSGKVSAGITIRRQKVISALDLSRTANVTLDRVWLAPDGGGRALVLGPGSVVKDSDIDGGAMAQGERIGVYGVVNGTYALARVRITGMSVGAWLDGSGTGSVSDTYIHDLVSIDGAHVDGFTRRGGTGPLRITRSRIDASGPNVTGALFLQNTWGATIDGVQIERSLLEGEGFVLALENKGAGTSLALDDVRIRSTGWGPVSASGQITYQAWTAVHQYDASRPGTTGLPLNRP
jgi:hypothetical protein